MNGRTFAALLLVIFLAIGGVFLGVSAYNAGVTAGLAQNLAQSGSDVVVTPGYATAPYVGWGYGWGNPGFGFFGFFFGLLFLFLILGLIRAAFGMGPGWGRGGWGPGGRVATTAATARRLERPGPGGPRRAPPIRATGGAGGQTPSGDAASGPRGLPAHPPSPPAPASATEAGASLPSSTMRTP